MTCGHHSGNHHEFRSEPSLPAGAADATAALPNLGFLSGGTGMATSPPIDPNLRFAIGGAAPETIGLA